ncbi:hypothetical protein [Paraflavitalea speifideaquila]|uniref:hypothetical protein n=1 Tax=Paraflavitalea speifideaquila TaxID=3076558 RepID=UPI0028EB1AD1|nr:hypothetical protein [Paraflavitalea speifideiaquila]
MKDLVKDAKDDREKARIIYDYLQKNFRYVSIQLGIGGWRSLSADFTDQKSMAIVRDSPTICMPH